MLLPHERMHTRANTQHRHTHLHTIDHKRTPCTFNYNLYLWKFINYFYNLAAHLHRTVYFEFYN